MAAPSSGGGGRRASTFRASRRAALEPNENDDLAAAPSPSSSPSAAAAAAATFGPAPPFSLPPRSPLAAIADPGRSPRSAPGTPKSLAGTPRACAAASGARDRSSSIGGAAKRVFDQRDLAAADVPVEVPHFELDEDPAFWMDRNVQVLVRARPISAAESTAHGQKRCLIQDSSKTLSWTGHPETMFTFDHVACETISQALAKELVRSRKAANQLYENKAQLNSHLHAPWQDRRTSGTCSRLEVEAPLPGALCAVVAVVFVGAVLARSGFRHGSVRTSSPWCSFPNAR